MKARYFNIGDDDWHIVLCYDYNQSDFDKMWSLMRAIGLSDDKAQASLSILSKPNTGMTLTSTHELMSLIFISEATSEEQWFDTLLHELKHLVEHISEFYRVPPTSEPAAYLQGEIGKQFFPIIVQKLCEK